MKIKIINETDEDTKLLRKITKLVALHEGVSDNIRVRFIKARGKWVHGTAHVGRISVASPAKLGEPYAKYEQWHIITKMSLPLDWKNTQLESFLQVFIHEFGHTLGLRHRDMMDCAEIDVLDLMEQCVRVFASFEKSADCQAVDIQMPVELVG